MKPHSAIHLFSISKSITIMMMLAVDVVIDAGDGGSLVNARRRSNS